MELILEACSLEEAEFARPQVSRFGMFTQNKLYLVRWDSNGESYVLDDKNRENYGYGLVCRMLYFKYKNSDFIFR
ncbi:hypothetical protein K0T92_04855 [Paenibacillus oenotherae]|uniref:Uncharacterized protein n=1 Tax=Paenibacillus oenotherae TaxID=1435645 RepID=A0ABS7D293_9BACL|nr:hypothetical protein [Paenibacillus oenotherae]MBW7474062.1 hypothetical protein [Paenibacillus oenotherae]